MRSLSTCWIFERWFEFLTCKSDETFRLGLATNAAHTTPACLDTLTEGILGSTEACERKNLESLTFPKIASRGCGGRPSHDVEKYGNLGSDIYQGSDNQLRVAPRLAAPTFCKEDEVVEQVVCLGRGLQQGHQGGGLLAMVEVPQKFDDLERGAAVQPSAYFILRRHFCGECWRNTVYARRRAAH